MSMRLRNWMGQNPLKIIKRVKKNKIEKTEGRYYFLIIKIRSFAKS